MLKKIGFLILCLFFSFPLLGCGEKHENRDFKIYVNTIVSHQEEVVVILKGYYQNLEKIEKGEDMISLYKDALSAFDSLYHTVAQLSQWKNNSDLKNALLDYITGVKLTFQENEGPVVDMVTSFSGHENEFFEKSQLIFPSYAMNLSSNLSHLDANFLSEYTQYIRQYN